MLIYRCDSCGHEQQVPQIVGNEFEYFKSGFGSLAVPVGMVRDLCKVCMKRADEAFTAANRAAMGDVAAVRQAAVAAALKAPLPPPPIYRGWWRQLIRI